MRLNAFITLLVLSCTEGFALDQRISFKHLTADDGLLYNIVMDVIEDRYGIIWFATSAGVCSYNGFEFTYYKNDPSDPTSLSHNLVGSIIESFTGDIYICTRGGGLNIYNRRSDNFLVFRANGKEGSLSNDDCESILQDSDGNIWIGTHTGLDLFQPESETFVNYSPSGPSGKEIPVSVQTIFEDDKKNLWLGTLSSGLYSFNTVTRSFQYHETVTVSSAPSKLSTISDIAAFSGSKLLIASGNGLLIYDTDNRELDYFTGMGLSEKTSKNYFHVITKDSEGKFWIGSDIGLLILNAYENTHQIHSFENDNPRSLTNNDIRDIYEDSNGNIWICTRNGGVNIYDKHYNSFGYLSFRGEDDYLITNNINSLHTRDGRVMWIGTNGGLVKYNRREHMYRMYQNEPGKSNTLPENHIMALFEDSRGLLWIGGKRDGLSIFDTRTERFRKFNCQDQNVQLDLEAIIDIMEDPLNNIWIATSGRGLIRFNPETNSYKHYQYAPEDTGSLSNNWITDLYLDRENKLWVATTHGVNLYRGDEDRFSRFFSSKDHNSLSINHVRTVYQDSQGFYWFGTYGGGLNRYDPVTNIYTLYNEKNGLSGDIVQGIMEDDMGCLWISTNNGITRLSLDNGEFEKFDKRDGLQGNNFNSNAHMNSPDGVFYFGGDHGITYFDPAEIQKNLTEPAVYISSVKVFDEFLDTPSERKGPFLPDRIELSHKQSFLTFEFFAIDFSKPYKTRYKYIFEGLDEHWNSTDASSRQIGYSSIPPGEYVFRVIASNGDGIWNEAGDELVISIDPPFWKSNMAYAAYFFLIVIALMAIRRYILLKERERNARKMEKLEHEKLHEIDQFKLKLYTNIYHDLRTPLTLILGPLNDTLRLEEVSSNRQVVKNLNIIKKNASRLLRLVNQLMDIRRIDTGNYKLKIVRCDLCALANEVCQPFQPSLTEKQIDFIYECRLDGDSFCFDPKIVESILTNLLSNALKFTAENGRIVLKIDWIWRESGDIRLHSTGGKQKNGFVKITVEDNGCGISQEDLPHIFERFYRGSGTKSVSGSGIGLSLSKELAELHHGTIEVESQEGSGTIFTVYIPADPEAYTEVLEESADSSGNEYNGAEDSEPEPVIGESAESGFISGKLSDREKSTVLLAEDDVELRQYIGDHLKKSFNFIEAGNGEEAYELALEQNPNIIVSDIIMPVMDGFTLCKVIKTNEKTSHIPVLLLTSLSDNMNEIEGYETGADEYVTKPFDINLLALRIHNLIESRALLKKKFSSEITLSPKDITITPIDEVFLNKTMDAIETNMSEPDFTVDDLVREVGVSRSLFYLKIKELTGQPAKEFIKSMRLKRAAQYIVSNQFNVSEVAYMVGFKDPKYFSKCFEKQFGDVPKVYKAKYRENKTVAQ